MPGASQIHASNLITKPGAYSDISDKEDPLNSIPKPFTTTVSNEKRSGERKPRAHRMNNDAISEWIRLIDENETQEYPKIVQELAERAVSSGGILSNYTVANLKERAYKLEKDRRAGLPDFLPTANHAAIQELFRTNPEHWDSPKFFCDEINNDTAKYGKKMKYQAVRVALSRYKDAQPKPGSRVEGAPKQNEGALGSRQTSASHGHNLDRGSLDYMLNRFPESADDELVDFINSNKREFGLPETVNMEAQTLKHLRESLPNQHAGASGSGAVSSTSDEDFARHLANEEYAMRMEFEDYGNFV